MNKLNSKTEEGVMVVVALFVLISSMLNQILSIIIALISLSIFFVYNLMTKKQ